MLKKFIAVLLVICMTVSLVPTSTVGVSAAGAATTAPAPAPAKPNIWKNTAKTFGINKLYTNGLILCGTVLVKIADATECEELQAVTSFLNKWVFGGAQGQTLAAIKAMCIDILNELDIIETKLTTYTSMLQKLMTEAKYNEAMHYVDEKWQKDVIDVENSNNVRNALNSYKKYMNVAKEYSDGTASLDDIDEAKNELFDDFCRIYSSVNGGFSSADNTQDKKKEIIFSDSTIDDIMVSVIKTLSDNLNNDSNYADAVAQFAFESLQFCSDQHEYIKINVEKQFTEIMLLEMVYQEFLSQRGEYLEEHYPGDEERWGNYSSYVEKFSRLNEDVADEMNTMLDRDLKVSPVNGIYLKLEEYPQKEDATTIVMRNYEFQSPYQNAYFPHFVKKDVKFNRVFTLNNRGIHSFAILDGTQYDGVVENGIPNHMRMIKLIDKDVNLLADSHLPNGDFYNLTKIAKYGDGTNNNYRPVQEAADFHELFNTPAFALCDNTPIKYLADYLFYANGYPLYFMTSHYSTRGQGSHIATTYTTYKVMDAYQQDPEANLKIVDVDMADCQEGKDNYDTAYSVVLSNKDTTFKQKTKVAVNGSGKAEIFIDGDNGEKLSNVTKNVSSKLTVRFKATEEDTVLKSISVKRHNQASDKNKTTSEITAVSKEQIDLLDIDENGYYVYEFVMPYSDVTISLNTEKGYGVYSQATNSSEDHILLDSYSSIFIPGETVNFSADASVISVSLQYGDVSQEIKLTELNDSEQLGSFVMPDSDVTLCYTIDCSHEYSNGFCTKCGYYQPADYNSDTETYEIGNAGQLYWFAALVNGERTNAVFDEQNSYVNAILMADIVVNDETISELSDTELDALRTWTPIGNYDKSYMGIFDGKHHTISGLYYKDSSVDNIGLFGYARGGADIYNVGVVNSYFEGRNCVGGILGRNNNSGVTVQRSFSEATVIGKEGVAGILGSTYGGKIIDCYNAGSVTGDKFVASIRGRNTYSGNGTMKNCFNVGEVTGTGTENVGGIRGDGNGSISNCYCISTMLTDTSATTMTPEQFASGEVAYLLNQKVSDGSQVWYQNIDNGKKQDAYPKFKGGGVYYLADEGIYTNANPELPNAFEMDAEGNLIIKTYDELVELSKLVRSKYDIYGSQNYILTNDIKAPADSEWTLGIGSVEDDKSFNGTFDGKGYCIIGLHVNSGEYGGLFELIGENGCVKDLFVFDCEFASSSRVSGGIAAVNNGIIDHCISGVNLTSGTIHLRNKTINAAEFNSIIDGEISGGIAGKNNGTIIGSRNAALVKGTQCGGITAINTGKIYGCANNAVIGTSDSSISGGLAGKNGGVIESSYNSANINGKAENTKGSIAGINGYDELNPTLTNIFYMTADGLSAVGADSVNMSNDTNIGMSSEEEFKSSSFVEKLNEASDDSVVWVYNSRINKGYPTISSKFLKVSMRSAGHNISVRGYMHEDLNVSYEVCGESTSEYARMSSAVGENEIIEVYSVSLTDNSGNYIPSELWCQEAFEISVPVEDDNVRFALMDTEGNIVYHEPESVENGIAVFTSSYPMSFAIVESKNMASETPDSVQTGDNSDIWVKIMLVSGCFGAAIFLMFAERKKRKAM